MHPYDVIIIGAGAAGMMCAIEAGKRNRRVLLIDHAEAPGEKIRISGGGRCNFTNLHTGPGNFISQNPHFCKSALSRYTQRDFIKLVERHNITWHEKTLGQLFCDNTAKDIISMLLDEMDRVNVRLELETSVKSVRKTDGLFQVETTKGAFTAASLVIASGGLSIPKMGATGFGYDIAGQFGLHVIKPEAALVPLTFDAGLLEKTKALSGLSVDPTEVSVGKTKFREALLFTHRGLSGPAILQISSYWREGREITVNLLPDRDIFAELKHLRQTSPKIVLHNALAQFIPKRLAEMIAAQSGHDIPLADLSDQKLKTVAAAIHQWRITPVGTEGFRTAEVTRGGIDTDELSSKTFEAKKAPGLYFIGEAIDVTGHLGGHNFQWAWSSGWCAGQFV
ncbi:MAG: NAD(P)/FAD-dependent oxidoreductase [Alphaproteobacteria bacterium]|nr:NAD(P)/FAD-dependent oxidoreductase [Alphaproteobacteria bacterium]